MKNLLNPGRLGLVVVCLGVVVGSGAWGQDKFGRTPAQKAQYNPASDGWSCGAVAGGGGPGGGCPDCLSVCFRPDNGGLEVALHVHSTGSGYVCAVEATVEYDSVVLFDGAVNGAPLGLTSVGFYDNLDFIPDISDPEDVMIVEGMGVFDSTCN